MSVPSDFWIQTAQDGVFNFCDASKSTPITTYVIAHALARIPRFNAHSSKPWFVAEHSILVRQIAMNLISSPIEKRYAAPYLLLHDAHEAFTGDMSAPLKKYLRTFHKFDMHLIESEVDIRIRRDLRLPEPAEWCKNLVEESDIYALKIERGAFMMSKHEWVIDEVQLPAGLDRIGIPELRGGAHALAKVFRQELDASLEDFIHAR